MPHPDRVAREQRNCWTWGRTDQPGIRNKRALLGDGPWLNEPDRIEWQEHGFVCMAIRHSELGHWCGYVGVTAAHPWYRYNASNLTFVHGGVTKACDGKIHTSDEPIWWIGFDCAHYTDLVPGLHRNGIIIPWCVYRTEAFVRAEVADLAAQL
jgi:hypothetical protein